MKEGEEGGKEQGQADIYCARRRSGGGKVKMKEPANLMTHQARLCLWARPISPTGQTPGERLVLGCM